MTSRKPANKKRRMLVVTGSRAEFGLLRPVMLAIRKNRRLELRVVVAGEHLLAPANTWKEVAKEFAIAAKVPMQRSGDKSRADHAAACGRGVSGFAAAYKKIKPDWVVVLGDRIEAFAAASAASIAGIAVCHIHGGDRAEGIADEAMRHAITKMSHLHCAATKQSAERIVKMGEPKERVFVTGSPAIDGISQIRPLDERTYNSLGRPRAVVILHPWGASNTVTRGVVEDMMGLLLLLCSSGSHSGVLWLMPNSDPGFEHIVRPLRRFGLSFADGSLSHLNRDVLLSLFARLAAGKPNGVLVGNSSAGLIEAAALGLSVVNIGERQAGRERAKNVIDVPIPSDPSYFDEHFGRALQRALRSRPAHSQLFGDGDAGLRIADLLARIDPAAGLVRKRNSY